jgi:hypothetical protein
MRIVGIYSFNCGHEVISTNYADELRQVEEIIASVNSSPYKTKTSHEKTMPGKRLYSPPALNKAFKACFENLGWRSHREMCEYSTGYYVGGYQSVMLSKGAFRDMDFVKKRVGVEVQFGKYAFMVYNVCAKMTIFHKLDIIDVGIEIVPVKDFVAEMSSGVSYQ